VILTGGLGPTKDDITKFTLAKIFSSAMHEDKRVADHVRTMLERRGIEYNALNQSQAMVPDCCTVLFNAHGTAPGMWFEDSEGRVTISLPGVPFEMEHLMEDEVMPRLKAHFSLHANIHRTMITAGLPESMLAARIEEWEDALPQNLKLAYLPAPNIVRLRLSAYDAEDAEAVRKQIDDEFDKLYEIIPDHIVGFESATMQELAHKILAEKGLKLATAESCTGGRIASLFTAQAGASAYFMLGAVTYSNESKCRVLGVNPSTIEAHGAVSEQVACEMAEGARRTADTTYGIATTGIAGPSGGSKAKPVGTVWIGISTPTRTFAVCRNCGTDRSQIIARATAYAIAMLHEELK
jgi:nicotinamide-nucleotide amidase